jgi:hypothetical protein
MSGTTDAVAVFTKRPRFDYIPLDEKHPFYPEDAYSLCKQYVTIRSFEDSEASFWGCQNPSIATGTGTSLPASWFYLMRRRPLYRSLTPQHR